MLGSRPGLGIDNHKHFWKQLEFQKPLDFWVQLQLLKGNRFSALSIKSCASCLKTEIIVLTYSWTLVPSFYIHLCLQALQGGIWPHAAAYFWGLHCNYYNGRLSFWIGGEFGENSFHSHVFAIIFSSFLHTHVSFQLKNTSFPCR